MFDFDTVEELKKYKSFTCRVEPSLLNAFRIACNSAHRSVSSCVRSFMRRYAKGTAYQRLKGNGSYSVIYMRDADTLFIRCPGELLQEFKSRCYGNGLTMSDCTRQFMELYIDGYEY